VRLQLGLDGLVGELEADEALDLRDGVGHVRADLVLAGLAERALVADEAHDARVQALRALVQDHVDAALLGLRDDAGLRAQRHADHGDGHLRPLTRKEPYNTWPGR